jgi:hypothetical protein
MAAPSSSSGIGWTLSGLQGRRRSRLGGSWHVFRRTFWSGLNARAIRNWTVWVLAGRNLIGHFCDPLLTFSVDQVLSRQALEIPAHKRVGCILGQLRKFGRFASIALRCDQWVGHGTVEASRPGQAAHCEAELTVNLRRNDSIPQKYFPTRFSACGRAWGWVEKALKDKYCQWCKRNDVPPSAFRAPHANSQLAISPAFLRVVAICSRAARAINPLSFAIVTKRNPIAIMRAA